MYSKSTILSTRAFVFPVCILLKYELHIKLLNEQEVLCEIARISSGEINEVTLQYANELRNKKAS